VWPTFEAPGLGTWPTNSLVRAVYFLAALPMVVHLSARQGIPARITMRAFLFGVPAGLIGARLLDLIEYAGRYHSWADVLGRNGSSSYGALIAMFLFLVAFTRWEGVSLLRFLDAGAPAMALGEACTRVGCLLTGCCYGIPWNGPWAITFPPTSFAFRDQMTRGLLLTTASQSLPVHPVQLYGTGVMLAVTAGLIWLCYRRPPAGCVFFVYLAAYGALRLALSSVRAEVLPSTQVFSAIFFVTGLVGGYWTARQTATGTSVIGGQPS
jgi:phosphatidylglycerol:prolipoprotein diacylglycerol transferase